MKKIIFLVFCMIFLSSFISAEVPAQIVINQQPLPNYNLGDSISIPITIKSLGEVTGTLKVDLICNGKEVNFYKNGVKLSAGEEQKENPILVLTGENIGATTGTCKIKASIQDKYTISENFKISNKLLVTLSTEQKEFSPDTEVLFEGEVIKENGQPANGFIEINMINGNSSEQTILETVNNGFFSSRIILSKKLKAGQYLINLNAYEKDVAGEKTNTGFLNFNIKIEQIPTELEIVFENPEIIPGENLKVKGVLRDQTGEKIESRVVLTIKDSKQKVLEQKELVTDEILEYPIKYNEPQKEWSIFAVSNYLTTENKFTIGKKEEIKTELINKTLLITNIGNVIYNKTLSIKIGETFETITLLLDIDESKKYTLNAPDGEYSIEIVSEGIAQQIGSTMLTGKAVSVKEQNSLGLLSPLVWLFIVVICGFVAFLFFKKGYQRSFFGYITSFKNKKPTEINPIKSKKDRNTAVLTLSLKGDKQDSGIVSLKVKSLKDIENIGATKETIDKIISLSKDKKALLYENGDFLFFIFAPVVTKTFRNERSTLELAQGINAILEKHNKLFQPKIEFGISVNYGTIVAKPESGVLKFMSLGTFVTEAKKISLLANQNILISKEMNNRLRQIGGVKTEKQSKGNLEVYLIKDMRNQEEDQKFIGSFLKRLEKK